MNERRYKVVDAAGRTTNCATHSLDEAARALLDARERGERIEIRTGTGHRLSQNETGRILNRAVALA